MTEEKEIIITKEYLRSHLDEIFVFGDNIIRKGHGGAAILREEPNVYGFITKKIPAHTDDAYYKPEEYLEIYAIEIFNLKLTIKENPDKLYLISRLGGGIANKYKIWETVIEPRLKSDLKEFPNVKFLW